MPAPESPAPREPYYPGPGVLPRGGKENCYVDTANCLPRPLVALDRRRRGPKQQPGYQFVGIIVDPQQDSGTAAREQAPLGRNQAVGGESVYDRIHGCFQARHVRRR